MSPNHGANNKRKYWHSRAGEREAAELQEKYPSLSLTPSIYGETTEVAGVLPVTADIGYTIRLQIPSDYPHGIPVLRYDPKEVPSLLDRHIIPSSGDACLCVRSEYRKHWPFGSTLAEFVERLVVPHTVGQFCYDTHGVWPPNSGRSHGIQGIVEAYVELTAPLGNCSHATILRLMRMLKQRIEPRGHDWCPCGSGRRLRTCHFDAVRELRTITEPTHVESDFVAFSYALSRVGRS